VVAAGVPHPPLAAVDGATAAAAGRGGGCRRAAGPPPRPPPAAVAGAGRPAGVGHPAPPSVHPPPPHGADGADCRAACAATAFLARFPPLAASPCPWTRPVLDAVACWWDKAETTTWRTRRLSPPSSPLSTPFVGRRPRGGVPSVG